MNCYWYLFIIRIVTYVALDMSIILYITAVYTYKVSACNRHTTRLQHMNIKYKQQMNTFILGTLGLRLRSNFRNIVDICQHMSKVGIELSQAGLITWTLFIYLLIYLFTSKKVGKPTGYGRSLNVLNVHQRQLHRRITRLGCDDWLFCQELVKQKYILFRG
jgi:hypothetical protein